MRVLVNLVVLQDHRDPVRVHQEQQVFDRIALDQYVLTHGQLVAGAVKDMGLRKQRLMNDRLILSKRRLCDAHHQRGEQDACGADCLAFHSYFSPYTLRTSFEDFFPTHLLPYSVDTQIHTNASWIGSGRLLGRCPNA